MIKPKPAVKPQPVVMPVPEVHIDPVPVAVSDKAKHASKTKYSVLGCPSEEKHPIEFLAYGQPPKSRRKEDGTFYVTNSDQLVCNGCKESFSISSRGGFYSCQDTCDFNICVKCARCPGGHTL